LYRGAPFATCRALHLHVLALLGVCALARIQPAVAPQRPGRSPVGADLSGNGLQEQRLPTADDTSVCTLPDQTRNHSNLLNLAVKHDIAAGLSASAKLYDRRIASSSDNGDNNGAFFSQDVYGLSAADQAAPGEAGIAFPATPLNAVSTPVAWCRSTPLPMA
jgi:hypothetical protein